MDTLLRDLRYAARRLRKAPGFTLVAILSLTLGIGANTAAFSLVNAILLRRPPLAQPEELVEVHTTSPSYGFNVFSYPDYEDLQHATGDVFSGIAASLLTLAPHDLGDRVESVPAEMVSGNYFSVLGIRPALGRLFSAQDHVAPGGHPVVVLAYDYWQSAFGADPKVVGREIRLSGHPYTVVGVAPKEYQGTLRGLAPSLYVPVLMVNRLQPSTSDQLKARGNHSVFLIARLRGGATLARAQTAVAAFAESMLRTHPDDWPVGNRVVLTPVNDIYVTPYIDKFLAAAAGLLLAVVGMVLTIACANLASFLLAQARDRRREIAVRLALGARRGALVRQLLTESLLLGLLGGIGGVVLAKGLLQLLTSADLPLPIPITLDLSLDRTVLSFALGVSLAAGLLFGLVPALQATRPDVINDIKSENVGGGPRRRFTLRGTLVVGQVAVSLLLLVTTGLFLRSFRERQTVDPGFGHAPAAVVTFGIPSDRYSEEEGLRFVRRLEEQLGAIPGIEGVGVISNLHLNPLSTNDIGVNVEGFTPPSGQKNFPIDYATVDSGFFGAVGLPVLRGRNFGPTDVKGAPHVAVVNEAMANRFWPGQDPIGRVFRTSLGEIRIVGVTRTAKIRALSEDPRPFVYLPITQDFTSGLWLVARTRGDAGRTLIDVLAAMRALDPDVAVLQTRTMERHLASILLPARLSALTFTAFSALALTLAVVGIYGLVAYSLRRRSREIGIRLSLGAEPAGVVKLLMGSGMRLVAAGVAIGLLLSAAAARLLETFLFGVTAWDPVTFVAVPALLLATGALAAYLPARRATRVDPVVVLKAE